MERKNWAIVNDDRVFHVVTKRLIEKEDVDKSVLFFKNGKEILDYLNAHRSDPEHLPDVLLLDLNMPRMDGWNFMDHYLKIRNKLNKDIAIFIVSSSLDKKDITRAKELPAVHNYIVKPMNQQKLGEIINQLQAG